MLECLNTPGRELKIPMGTPFIFVLMEEWQLNPLNNAFFKKNHLFASDMFLEDICPIYALYMIYTFLAAEEHTMLRQQLKTVSVTSR